jgi:hypothetical protein
LEILVKTIAFFFGGGGGGSGFTLAKQVLYLLNHTVQSIFALAVLDMGC